MNSDVARSITSTGAGRFAEVATCVSIKGATAAQACRAGAAHGIGYVVGQLAKIGVDSAISAASRREPAPPPHPTHTNQDSFGTAESPATAGRCHVPTQPQTPGPAYGTTDVFNSNAGTLHVSQTQSSSGATWSQFTERSQNVWRSVSTSVSTTASAAAGTVAVAANRVGAAGTAAGQTALLGAKSAASAVANAVSGLTAKQTSPNDAPQDADAIRTPGTPPPSPAPGTTPAPVRVAAVPTSTHVSSLPGPPLPASTLPSPEPDDSPLAAPPLPLPESYTSGASPGKDTPGEDPPGDITQEGGAAGPGSRWTAFSQQAQATWRSVSTTVSATAAVAAERAVTAATSLGQAVRSGASRSAGFVSTKIASRNSKRFCDAATQASPIDDATTRASNPPHGPTPEWIPADGSSAQLQNTWVHHKASGPRPAGMAAASPNLYGYNYAPAAPYGSPDATYTQQKSQPGGNGPLQGAPHGGRGGQWWRQCFGADEKAVAH